VQIARHLGAEVFATASPPKWGALRSLGIDDDHIASSRDLDFRDRLPAVDVVIDSLAGEFVDASLELLSDGGRFVEMGKADVRDAEEVADSHPGVAYRAFDLMEAGPDRIGEMLGELMALFEGGVLGHLPLTAFDVREAETAFRHLSQARHVGKLVLTVPRDRDADGTVLITGGTGGRGALLARHLAAGGAKSLVLASRGGRDAEGAPELVAELADLGCEARAVACDVGDRDALAEVIDSIPDLTTVVHAAGVLDDGVVGSLDAAQLDRVMRPKADAAAHLDGLIGEAELILFSSVAGTLGGPGQGNYAAANAFLDALAQCRRTRGLPAQSLAWGLWEAGMGSRLGEADVGRMRRAGIGVLSAGRGLAALDAAREGGRAVALPMNLDLAALRAQARVGTLPPPLRGLVREQARPSRERGSLARRLAGVPEAERPSVVLDLVRGHVAAVLGHERPEAIDPDRAFKELGFDSLTAVELRNRLSAATGLRLPATLGFDHPTPAAVAALVLSEIAPRPATKEESEEEEIRSALASIPLSDLRQLGVLDTLLRAARSGDGTSVEPAPANGDSIDTMEVDDLVRRALDGAALATADGEGA
jgi:polyketide synthase 12